MGPSYIISILLFSSTPCFAEKITFNSASDVTCAPGHPDEPISRSAVTGTAGLFWKDCQHLCLCQGEEGSSNIICHGPDGAHLDSLTKFCAFSNWGNCTCTRYCSDEN